MKHTFSILGLLVLGFAGSQTSSKPAPPPQTKASMDFWVGNWSVFLADGRRIGTNRIEKILDGAAILEHWRDAGGGEGKSFFYWMPDRKAWKQVWVTPNGAYKEKVAAPISGGLLFTGEAVTAEGKRYPDRTKLMRQENSEVRQVIEYSTDGGKTWTKAFDAVYRRSK